MIEKAYAKINLSLDVIDRRDDGFHNLCSVMHTVSLCDELDFEIAPSDEFAFEFTSNISGIDAESNIVSRAANLYMSRAGKTGNIKIHLENRIPIGAGLGGASSDAACALRVLNRHFGCFSEEEMLELCAEIGSDVAFCYCGGTAKCEGRGEILTPIASDQKLDFVIAIGDERISTPQAYAALDKKFSNFDGTVSKASLESLPKVVLNEDPEEIVTLYNIFEEIIADEVLSVSKIKSIMTDLGASYTLMTGSGPAVFGIFADEYSASVAADELKKDGYIAFSCKSV